MTEEQTEEKVEEAPKKKAANTASCDSMYYKGGVETAILVKEGEKIPSGYKDAPT